MEQYLNLLEYLVVLINFLSIHVWPNQKSKESASLAHGLVSKWDTTLVACC